RLGRLRLLPACGLVGMIGLVVALSPARPRPVAPQGRPTWRVAAGELIGWLLLVGVPIGALLAEMPIVYLVLLAIEHVKLASRASAPGSRPGRSCDPRSTTRSRPGVAWAAGRASPASRAGSRWG